MKKQGSNSYCGYSHTGKVSTAISVSGPSSLFDGEQIESIVSLKVRTEQDISTIPGYIMS